MKVSKLRVLAAGSALVAIALAGCSSSGSSNAANTTSPSTGAATTSPSAAAGTDTAAGTAGSGATDAELASAQALVAQWSQPLTAASFPAPEPVSKPVDVKGKTIYLVPLSDELTVIHASVAGVEEALTKAGAKYKLCDGGAGGQPTPTNWGTCLKTAADNHADAVMSLYIDYNAVSAQFQALAKAHIPTLIAGVQETGLTPQPGLIDFFDNTGQLNGDLGSLAVSALAHGGKNTHLLWLRLLDSTATTGASNAGAAKFKQICANCEIETADLTTVNAQAQLAATVSAALVKYPDLNMIAVPVDPFTPLVLQGINQAGKSGKVQIVSASGQLDGLQRVKSGGQVATQSEPMHYRGWQFANGLMQLLAGQPVDKVTESVLREFNSTNVGSLTLTADQQYTDNWLTDGEPYAAAFLKNWGISS